MRELGLPRTDIVSRGERRSAASLARRCGKGVLAAFGRLLGWTALCRRRAIGRRDLAEMDARMLRDIGVSRPDAWVEANKPWWRP